MSKSKMSALFLPLFYLFYACTPASPSAEEWTKMKDHNFEYKIIGDVSEKTIEYGDRILFHYKLYNNGQLLESTFEQGAAIELVLPDKMHRNQFMEPLTLIGVGDSLIMRIPFHLAKEELSSVSTNFDHDDYAEFHYKILQLTSREEQIASKQKVYAKTKGFANVEDMLKEQSQMQQIASSKANDLKGHIQTYKKGTLDLKKGPQGLEYLHAQKGEGSEIEAGDEVYFFYQLAIVETAEIIGSNYSNGDRYILKMGTDTSLIPAFQLALSCLRNKGQATFFVPAPLGYGQEGSLPVVPANAQLALDLEIIHLKKDSLEITH